MLAWAYQVSMRCAVAKVDWETAEEIGQKAGRLASEVEIPTWIESGIFGLRAQVWIRQGKLAETEQALRERGVEWGEALHAERYNENVALVRLLLAQGKLDQAGVVNDQILKRVEAKNLRRMWIGALTQRGLIE